jgi:oligosaccharide repeat unit polymerase
MKSLAYSQSGKLKYATNVIRPKYKRLQRNWSGAFDERFAKIISYQMLALTILALCLLTAINYKFAGKSVLYPALIFSAVWTLALALLAVSDGVFYPVLPETFVIFLCGVLAFSVGCWLAILPATSPPIRSAEFQASSNRIITVLLSIVLIIAPFYYHWISNLVGEGDKSPFLLLARAATQEMMGKSAAFTFFGTISELSRIVAMMAFWEREKHPKRSVLAITVALVMCGLTGQKSGPLMLIISLICIDWIRTRRLRWKLLMVMAFIMIGIATIVEFYVHLGGESFSGNMGAIFRMFILYGSGGLVGFDRVVRQPNIIPQFNPIYVTILRVVRRLGGQADIPEVADFVNVGPNGFQDNVYTIFWAYLDFGYIGMLLTTVVIGFIVTLIYKRAIAKSHIFVFLYATLVFSIVFSIFTEYFVSMIYYLLKVCVVSWLVYRLPERWAQFRQFTARVTSLGLAARAN